MNKDLKEAWIESALKDYKRLAQILNENGIYEWEDTVTEIERLIDILKKNRIRGYMSNCIIADDYQTIDPKA